MSQTISSGLYVCRQHHPRGPEPRYRRCLRSGVFPNTRHDVFAGLRYDGITAEAFDIDIETQPASALKQGDILFPLSHKCHACRVV